MDETIDLRHLASLGGHRDDGLREIIEDFFTELSSQVLQAEAFLAASDARSMRDLAHKIRGMAGSLGFKPLSRLAAIRDVDQPVDLPESGWVRELREEAGRAAEAWDSLKST